MEQGLRGNVKCFEVVIYVSCITCKSKWLHNRPVSVKNGLRQGCSLSPILFNVFINDFALSVQALGKGIKLHGDERVNILLYADGIVFMAENENDLQSMLNLLHTWCSSSHLKINPIKSKIIHSRPKPTPKTNFIFTC